MAGTRLTIEDKALYTSNAQSDHRRTFRRYFGTFAVTVATAISTLGGNVMAQHRPPPVVVQDDNKQILAAQAVLTKDTGAITRVFESQKAADIGGEVLHSGNPLVQKLLADLIAQNNALRPLNSGNTVFPISGTTPQEQFNSLNVWLNDGKTTRDGLTPERLTLLNNKISEAFGTVNAAIAARATVREPELAPIPSERRDLELTVPQQKLAFDDLDYTSLLHDLALIREYNKNSATGAKARQYLADLERLYDDEKTAPANISELNRIYKEARKFAKGPVLVYARAEGQKAMEAATRQEKQEALLAIENERAQLAKTFPDRDLTAAMVKLDEAKRLAEREMYPDARRVFTDAQILAQNAPKKPELRVAEPEARGGVRTAETTSAKQAYLHDIAQKTVELARFSYRSLVGSPIPDRKQKQATEARIRALTATEKFLAEAEVLAANPTLTFDQVNSAYTTTLLRADTVQTMALLLRFAEANGMNKAPESFFFAYAKLMDVISSPDIQFEGRFEEKNGAADGLAVFYEQVSKLAPELKRAEPVINLLATIRASRDGFYAEYLQTVVEDKKQLTLAQSQKMLERAIAAYSPGRDPDTDPLLVAANLWKEKCTDPMTLYAMAHNLVSLREAEMWLHTTPGSGLYPFDVDPRNRAPLKDQLNLAREAFLWNYKDDFAGPIRVDPTYYPNMSTTLAEDVTNYLMPTLRFTGPYAGFYASVGAAQIGPGFKAAVETERVHIRMLLSMKYPFPADPWSVPSNKGLNTPLSIHHAFEFGEGPYAISRSTGDISKLASGKERIYYLGPVTDLHQDHDAPGFAHNGIGAQVLRREAVLVSDTNAPALLKSQNFNDELTEITAEFMQTGNGYVASLKVADVRIAELTRRLATVIEGDIDVPIYNLPINANDLTDPRIFYVQRALKALEAARNLKAQADGQGNTMTAKLAIEVAELGLEGLSDDHLRDIYTPVITHTTSFEASVIDDNTNVAYEGRTKMVTFFGDVSVLTDNDASTRRSLDTYEGEQGRLQNLTYHWFVYSQTADGTYYLCSTLDNGSWGYVGKVKEVGGRQVVVSVTPSGTERQDAGAPVILYETKGTSLDPKPNTLTISKLKALCHEELQPVIKVPWLGDKMQAVILIEKND